jgi:starvation-inducible outer membrane lipoprotein
MVTILKILGTFLIVFAAVTLFLTGCFSLAKTMQGSQDARIAAQEACIIKAHEAGSKSYTMSGRTCYLEAK